MPILNENLDWPQIVARRPDVGRAFRGTPRKSLLDAGAMLCRFITTESNERKSIRGNEIFFSEWWTDWSTTASMLAHWKSFKSSPKDIVRARLALTTDFSQELDSLVQIILTKSVYAWRGIAQHQDDTVRKLTYLGGGEQLYLPNLASDAHGLHSYEAYLHCFTAIESLE